MKRNEALKTLKGPAATVVAVGAIIFGAYKANEAVNNAITSSSETKLEAIYKPLAVDIGTRALRRAMEDGIPGSITEDEDAKGTVNVLIQSNDGTDTYDILAQMHEKNGEPDPSTTYEILIEEHYGRGDRVKEQVLIINDNDVVHEGSWGAVYKNYSYTDQENPKLSSVAELANDKENKAVRDLAKILADIALRSPAEIPAPTNQAPEDNPII